MARHTNALPGSAGRAGSTAAGSLATWDPSLLMSRLELERIFEAALRERVSVLHPSADPVDVQLRELIASDDPRSRPTRARGTIEMFREFLMHRSATSRRPIRTPSRSRDCVADPRQRWSRSADEYGGGDATWMHSALFAGAMSDLGLDPTEGRYVPLLPGVTLATVNLMSLLGLHRLRGSAVGHLAIFEMTSCTPNRRYGDGLRRLGFVEGTTRYFDEHVQADAAHGSIAANDMAASLVDDPRMLADVLSGASAPAHPGRAVGDARDGCVARGTRRTVDEPRHPSDVGRLSPISLRDAPLRRRRYVSSVAQGCVRERPHRQSGTTVRRTSSLDPLSSITTIGPRTRKGPSR